MSITTEAMIIVGIFSAIWGWIIYEMYYAPEMDDEGNYTNRGNVKDKDEDVK